MDKITREMQNPLAEKLFLKHNQNEKLPLYKHIERILPVAREQYKNFKQTESIVEEKIFR